MTVLGAYRLSDDSIVMFADRRSVSDGMSIISEDEDKIYRYVYNEITYTILLTGYCDTYNKFISNIDKYTHPDFFQKISSFFETEKESSFIVSDGKKIYYCTEHITEYKHAVSSLSYISAILRIYTPKDGMDIFNLCKKHYALCGEGMDVVHLNRDGTVKNQKRFLNTLNIKQI